MNGYMVRAKIQLRRNVANKVTYQQAFKLFSFEVFSV